MQDNKQAGLACPVNPLVKHRNELWKVRIMPPASCCAPLLPASSESISLRSLSRCNVVLCFFPGTGKQIILVLFGICLNSVTIISCQLPSKGVVPAVQICISQTCNHAGKRQHICIAIPALPGTRLVSIKHMSSVFNSLLTQSKLILLLFFPLWLYQ